jgi:DNA-binding MarR family transcriptional regulator
LTEGESSESGQSGGASELGRLLNLVSSGVQLVGQRALASTGVTLAQWRVLASARSLGPCRLGDLAAACELDQAATSRLVSRLEALGHLERRANPDDKRSTHVVLSASGQAVALRCGAALGQVLPRVVEGLCGEELRALVVLLRKLDCNLTTLLDQG